MSMNQSDSPSNPQSTAEVKVRKHENFRKTVAEHKAIEDASRGWSAESQTARLIHPPINRGGKVDRKPTLDEIEENYE